MAEADLSDEIVTRVTSAFESETPLRLRAGGTKDFYGRRCEGEPLELAAHAGIVSYEPTELVVTARAGTPLSELEALLAERGQQLPFEPPAFGESATIGGVVAAGLSGPRRPYAGSVRDALLGVKIVNGRGELLEFGGQVMKNVAGYDVSRVIAGSLGTLGVILEVSIKVLPKPPLERTVVHELDETRGLEQLVALGLRPLSVTATCHVDGRLYTRVCGGERALEAAEQALGGETVADSGPLWQSVREHAHAFFAGTGPLWRLAVPPASPPLDLGETLIEWGGSLRWLRDEAPEKTIRAKAANLGGHATLFRGHDGSAEVFHPLPSPLMKLHRNLKRALDPKGILNPGRLYAEL
ncbi:MAG: glycolate oxidase subunit GlcE [Chromatiales bacterium]|jgi:glycolate oxidase FAD binding subunit